MILHVLLFDIFKKTVLNGRIEYFVAEIRSSATNVYRIIVFKFLGDVVFQCVFPRGHPEKFCAYILYLLPITRSWFLENLNISSGSLPVAAGPLKRVRNWMRAVGILAPFSEKKITSYKSLFSCRSFGVDRPRPL